MKYLVVFMLALCGVVEACPPVAVGQFNSCPTNAPLVGAYLAPVADPPAVAFFVAESNYGYNAPVAAFTAVGHNRNAQLRAAQFRAAAQNHARAQSLRAQALRSQVHVQQFNAGSRSVTSEKIQRFGVLGQRRSVTERFTQN